VFNESEVFMAQMRKETDSLGEVEVPVDIAAAMGVKQRLKPSVQTLGGSRENGEALHCQQRVIDHRDRGDRCNRQPDLSAIASQQPVHFSGSGNGHLTRHKQSASRTMKLGMLFPPQSNILEVEIQTAARVAKLVFDSGLARVERPDDMVTFIRQHVYKPVYQISSDKAASSSKRGVGVSA
jgi:hypothetical protein